ncbi:PLP-dependent transferase [Bacillus alkalicellulosilyticus]|uniref:PLP-dependent transferase n=1 Tax=Alkalihalobacterium alkalicellulosilyticum TaxID=1912214 RepID=UPI0009966704|nr:PLP-dependent aspartate aminotransferase family protein [Bacillus alkalicellulosilyticus]
MKHVNNYVGNNKEIPIYKDIGFILQNDDSINGENYIYSRHNNPTIRMIENHLCEMENAKWSLISPSGMSAIDIALSIFQSRNKRPWAFFNNLYSGTISYIERVLVRRGIVPIFIDDNGFEEYNLEYIKEVIRKERPEVLFFESISNPLLIVPNFYEIIKIAKLFGTKVIIDNTLATPLIFNPLDLGASLVIHSATKYLSGHNTLMAGIIFGNDFELYELVKDYQKCTGQVVSPENAFNLFENIKTFEIRFRKQCENAYKLASLFNCNNKAIKVRYPGLTHNHINKGQCASNNNIIKLSKNQLFGAVIVIQINLNTKLQKHDLFINLLSSVMDSSPSLGATRSSILNVGSFFTSKKTNYSEGLYRLSIGIEDISKLEYDFSKALNVLE